MMIKEPQISVKQEPTRILPQERGDQENGGRGAMEGSRSLWTAGPHCDREAGAGLARNLPLTDERVAGAGHREHSIVSRYV